MTVAAALNAKGTRNSRVYAVVGRRALLGIIATSACGTLTPASAAIAALPETLIIVIAATGAWRATTAIAGDALVILGTRVIV